MMDYGSSIREIRQNPVLKSVRRMNGTASPTLDDIESCLPQTQCTKCGYPSCSEYAVAVRERSADINRCPPGGEVTTKALANLLAAVNKPLAEDCEPFPGRQIARIRETDCIGCTLCIAPCPTDAIIGTNKHMHTVLLQNCTGCGICVDFCPVDCIEMIAYQPPGPGLKWTDFSEDEVSHWSGLARRRKTRLKSSDTNSIDAPDSVELKSQIREAVNRERSRRWKQAKRSRRQTKN